MCLCALWLIRSAAVNRLASREGSATRAEQASQGLDEYDFHLRFRPDEKTLSVVMTLRFINRTGDTLPDIVLRTWAGAYQSEEHSPAAAEELYDSCYPNGFSPGGIALQGVWWNGAYAQEAAFDDVAQTVLRVPVGALAAGEEGVLTLNCIITVPECAHRLGVSRGIWQFGNALPILSLYEDGAWRTDAYESVGDPFVSACANYTVALDVPEGYLCAAAAACESEKTADGQRIICRAPAVREFAFALSRDWTRKTTRAGDVTVVSLAGDASGAERAAGYARRALETFSSLYGAYPYDTFTVCAVDFPFGGMEYAGLVLIGQSYYAGELAATLELIVAHEAAHQWFYALVGSDQYACPWQDEALCEYAMLRYARARYGQSAYENLLITRVYEPLRENIRTGITPGSPVDYFSGLEEYTSVVYGRGAAFVLAVEEMTGNADGFLRAYCERFAFAYVTRAAFEMFLNEWSGMDLSPLLTDYIDTSM